MIESLKQSQSLYNDDIFHDNEQLGGILHLLNNPEYPELNQFEQSYLEKLSLNSYRKVCGSSYASRSESRACDKLGLTGSMSKLSVSNIDSFFYFRRDSRESLNHAKHSSTMRMDTTSFGSKCLVSKKELFRASCLDKRSESFLNKNIQTKRHFRQGKYRTRHHKRGNYKIVINLKPAPSRAKEIKKEFMKVGKKVMETVKNICMEIATPCKLQMIYKREKKCWYFKNKQNKKYLQTNSYLEEKGDTSLSSSKQTESDLNNIFQLTYLNRNNFEKKTFQEIYSKNIIANSTLHSKSDCLRFCYFFFCHSSRCKLLYNKLSDDFKQKFLIFLYFKIFDPKEEKKLVKNQLQSQANSPKTESLAHAPSNNFQKLYEELEQRAITKIQQSILLIRKFGSTTNSLLLDHNPKLETLDEIDLDRLQLLFCLSQLKISKQMTTFELIYNSNSISYTLESVRLLKKSLQLKQTKTENHLKLVSRFFLRKYRQEYQSNYFLDKKINKSNISKIKSENKEILEIRHSGFGEFLRIHLLTSVFEKIKLLETHFGDDVLFGDYLVSSSMKRPYSIQQLLNCLEVFDGC